MAAKTAAKAATKSKLIPLADRIVITPLKQDEVTASGLVIPDTAKEKPQQG
ncbi:MAG: co-chaperone GroES, partial [Dehalococcoidia bacterium]|nr:co-chaperone GroES [Dehalococcoidia bacterium]